MTTVGADVEALRQLAQMFTDNSSKLTGDVIPTINSRLNSSCWVGEDADSFKADWHGHLMGQLNNAATQLSDAAATLNRNADEQEQASSIAGASSALQSGLSNPQPANNDPAAEKAKHWWEKAGDSIADWWNKPLKDKLHDISDVTGKAAAVCTIAAGLLTLTGVGAPVGAALFTAGQALTIVSASTDIASNGMKLYDGDIGWGEFIVETGFDAVSIAGAGGTLAKLSETSTIATQAVSGEIKQAATTPINNTAKLVCEGTTKETLHAYELRQGVLSHTLKDTLKEIGKETFKDTERELYEANIKYAAQWCDNGSQAVYNPYETVLKPIVKGAAGSWGEFVPTKVGKYKE